MKRNGNSKSNRNYNPQNTKPPIPLDVDEVDSVLEKFIRQKYDQQLFVNGNTRPAVRNDTGSTRSSEDQPPPLPPKPGRRFGFGLRSASSALPAHKNGPTSPPRSPRAGNAWGDEPLRVNKQSRVFGAMVGGNNDNLDTKLAQLRDMGFTDEKRNVAVLKGLSGNVERTIEQLVRLGESNAPNSRARVPLQTTTIAASQPVSTNTSTVNTTSGQSPTHNGPRTDMDTSSWGQQSEPSPTEQPASRNPSTANPYQAQATSYNPFAPSSDQHGGMASMNQAISNMQISQQPLFPNATGGYPNLPPHPQESRLQTMTPPVQQAPHQFMSSNPYAQQNSPVSHTHNPFFQQVQPSSLAPAVAYAPYTQQPPSISSNDLFMPNNAMPIAQMAYQPTPPQMYSPNPQQGAFQQQISQQQISQNSFSVPPYHSAPQQNNIQSQPQFHPSWNPYGQQTLQPGRLDKSSILSLYNSPHLAPQPLVSGTNTQTNSNTSHEHLLENIHPPQRSVTMPIQPTAGTNNPFQQSLNKQPSAVADFPAIGRHVSQESVDIGANHNGRHSPDAFASLSARFVR
ncbi:uncharacterized protein KY384_001907 [Bacidia gigantensis]|uniref:uncharacterized protein n=1 Tax=Bacidia gigantensis TaxID=2732470 RepID=UPI001D03D015|nr:uncharacterized protein KY384_001907 [Bacidia gigantensis]KAG8533124.1 hypothetical protein KY384_001907 [Bacidia gigantensis]